MLRSPMRRRYRPTGPDAATRNRVLARAAWACERCGVDISGGDYSIHHRRARKMGGTTWPGINQPSNLLVVCGSGTTGCHGEIESHRADAVRAGWLVASFMDPAKVSVLITGDRWRYLNDLGDYVLEPA